MLLLPRSASSLLLRLRLATLLLLSGVLALLALDPALSATLLHKIEEVPVAKPGPDLVVVPRPRAALNRAAVNLAAVAADNVRGMAAALGAARVLAAVRAVLPGPEAAGLPAPVGAAAPVAHLSKLETAALDALVRQADARCRVGGVEDTGDALADDACVNAAELPALGRFAGVLTVADPASVLLAEASPAVALALAAALGAGYVALAVLEHVAAVAGDGAKEAAVSFGTLDVVNAPVEAIKGLAIAVVQLAGVVLAEPVAAGRFVTVGDST